MDIEPHSFFQLLEEHSENNIKGPSECLRLLSILNYNLTEEQLNSSLIDLYLFHIFDKSHGLFKFILKVAPNSNYEKAAVKSLEVIYTLVNNFSIQIEQHILDINEKCLKIVTSKSSAKIMTKALDVLLISFEKVDKGLESQNEYLDIFQGIKCGLIRGIHTDSVRQKEFLAVGLFAKKFSYLISDPNEIKKYFVGQLDIQMAKGPSQNTVYGIFTGLTYFCENFPLSLENPEDAVIIEKLYKYIKVLSKPQGTVRFGNRAVLMYFADNLNLFRVMILQEFKQWHKRLLIDWLPMGVEEKKVAEQALRALLLNIAESVVDMNKNESTPILTHFIGWFKSIFRKPDASYAEKKLCIHGLKYFSQALYKHYSKEEAREIFLLVMQNFEKIYILNQSVETEEWEFLPDYVQCLASFMRYQSFTNIEIYCLQRSVISMIKTFHNLKPLDHSMVIDSLVTTLFYLKETKHFDSFLENIVYQGVVWSCSHQHVTDSDLADETEKIVTVKNYFPLWKGLLKLTSNRSYDKVSIYYEDRQYILTKLVNELVKTLMLLVNKLNVNVILKEDICQTDIETTYKVEQLNDYAIFLNITDFYQEIFNNIDPEMFQYCICKIINHLVAKCVKYRLVSGFYKLLSFALKISNDLKLFEKGNITLNQDVANCKETLSKFLTFLLHKMKQFKDELLISCLYVLLESPSVVVEALLQECIGIFITVFELGRSYIALANIGLTTLERWQQSIDQAEFESFLLQVIPSLDSYLRSKSLGGLQISSMGKKRKTAQELKKRTVLVELEPELVKFQKRVLHFVGSQNDRICQAFVSPDHNFQRKITSDNLHLKVILPYEDLSLEIHLEPFITRVIELCLYSSDRKTRIVACELLQAFVMVFLGKTKLMPHSSLSDLDDLLQSIAMPLLQLACDIDQVVRQIFEPLFMQLIHWYTSKVQRESPHLAVLIEVLMEGITHPTNSSLRDFSGKCIDEFVKWTIKQHSEQELKNSPTNIKVLVKRMRFFSGHPDLTKKMGAALIFNNIYKEIREERVLISIFSMELLHIFICSLSLLDSSNEKVDNVVFQISNAIAHLKRIFIEKPQLFRDVDELRRTPSDISEGNLKGLSKWLLSMTASRSKYCRDVSMDLFVHLQPLSGTNEYLSSFAQHCYSDILSLYKENLKQYPTLDNVNSSDDSTVLNKWLQALLCFVDGYVFVIKNSLCVFDLEDHANLISIRYFLKNIQNITIEQGLRLIHTNSPKPYYTTLIKEQFLNLKSSCSLAILKLSIAILNDDVLRNQSSAFWNEHFWNLILNFTFNPFSLGFDERMSQPEYFDVLVLLMNTMPRKLDEKSLQEIVVFFRKYVTDHLNVDVDLNRNVSLKQRNILKGLQLIQNTQFNKPFLAHEFSEGFIDKLMSSFLRDLDQNTVYVGRLSEITTEYCSQILRFALSNPNELIALWPYLCRDTLVTCQEMTNIDSEMTFGLYLLMKFTDPIAKVLTHDFDKFLGCSDNIGLIVKLTSYLLKYLDTDKELLRINFDKIVEGILDKWFLFELYFEENSIDLGLDFISQIRKILGHVCCSGDIQKWVLDLICRDEVLLSEQEGVSFYLNVFRVLAEIADDNLENLSSALQTVSTKMIAADKENSTVIEKLLAFLPTVKSQAIFEFLIELYVTSNKTIDLTDLLTTFMRKSSENTQSKILQTTYLLALNETGTFMQKKKLVDNILPYVFKNSLIGVFESFFEDNIKVIMERLKNPCDLGNQLIDFLLVELLFLRVDIGSDERTHCKIIEASGNPKLKGQLLKSALDAFKNSNEDGNKDYLRLYKCGAYKALASMISNSIKTESFYAKLFIREENHQDILWSALINTDITYNFPVDFDSYPKKKKVLVNIRDELRERNSYRNAKSLRYMESQRLFNSSLSEDITKFDFTTSILRTHPSTKRENAIDEPEEEINVETKFAQDKIYLEATEINNHELMGTICGIIEHMFTSGICQLPEDDEELVEFPNWMNGIRNLLLNPTTHKNVKIFWVKVIDNMVHIFRFFAKYFVEPLLLFLNDRVAGKDVNYFITDVIVILASWTILVKPNEKEAKLASDFLDYLIRKLNNKRKDVFKYNLELIKLIVENWKDFIKVPYESLSVKLNFPITDRTIEVGLHVTSIFLVNDMLPCEVTNINAFWSKLTGILMSSVSTIYKPCAETIGLMLKYFKSRDMEQVSFDDAISKSILQFEADKYARCLESVAVHYPEIVNSYHIIKMLNRLSQSTQELQNTFFKIIFKRADILGEIESFKNEDWSKYLASQDARVQLITMEIILKTYQFLKEQKQFKEIVKSVSKNLQHPNTFCRGRMYDILMAIFECDDVAEDIIDLCKEVLIQGLIDNDIEIKEKIWTFWSQNTSIPSTISKKFPYLMSNFYLAKTEDHFLGYVSYFLLNSIDSEEYEKELFEHPLEDCDFEEYRLQTNWRVPHPSVVPMFAETLKTYTERLDDNSSVNLGVLRATHDNFTFAPTQQTARERHISQITGLESSLIGTSVVSSRSGNEMFINPNAIHLSEKYKLPKRRFLKDKAKISGSFAQLAVSEKIQKNMKRYDAVKESEKKVTIYRSYRKGDFPDIQITLGALVKPLQMLVLHDSELSKLFFSVVYKTLRDKLKDVNREFITAVLHSIKRIFTDSVQYNANVFSTLLDILLKSKQEIRINPSLISTVCQQSGLISVGTLLIEEYLIDIEDTPTTSKRGLGSEDLEMLHWLKLAELYKELHEWNIVRTIFLEHSNCKEEAHKAIILESEKRWREAQERYEKLIQVDLSAERRDFYYESYFKCLAHLGEWEKLPEKVELLVPEGGEKTWNSLWDNDWFQQKILPWYVGAKVKNILFSGQPNEQFLLDVNKSLSTPEQAEYLKNKFSEELCILWLTQKDTSQATQFLKSSLENFLSEWQLLNPVFSSQRYNKVLNLRTLIEIERFLDTEKTLTESSGEENLKSLQNYWKSTQKEFLPSIVLSEVKLLYRQFFNKLLSDKLTKLEQLDLAEDLKHTCKQLDISFMNLSIEEGNYYMTRKYYRNYASVKDPNLTMIYANLSYLYSNLVKSDPGLKLEKLLEALKKFREVVKSIQDDRVLTSLLKIFDISQTISEVLSNHQELYDKYDQTLNEIFGNENNSFVEMASQSLKLEALNDTGRDHVLEERTKALVKLAYYVQDREEREQDFVLYILRAMRLGSKEARQLFPCILLMESLEAELKDIFVNETENIPTWMFLGWIPQLLANADTCKISAISAIILRIAKSYPQALMYSYRLSKENYANTDSEYVEETKRLTDELDRLLLNDPIVDKFLTALSKVSVPLVTLQYYIKKMATITDIEKIIQLRDDISEFFFKDSSNSKDSNSMQGNMYTSVGGFKNDFKKIDSRLKIDKLKPILKTINEKRIQLLDPSAGHRKPSFSMILKDYCPWLANFSAGKLNLELEIPGQYNGDKMPLVQHHVKISGFCDTVIVMKSLRKPIKVTMLGMDGKEYPFLIKFGEDIRQDQRIQQLFVLMNNIFISDHMNHHVLTYQVIPLNSSLGIIQWVENTISLEDFVKKSIPDKKRARIFNSLYTKYLKFMGGNPNTKDIDMYGQSAIKKNRTRVIPFFRELANEIPFDVLRTSIWSVSLTTESFLVFKSNFIKSYAALCVCHWILGIGDRHLQNSKVCTRNGKVLGIDFGHAFGTATQILPIPELVPIRLTPHIVNLMEPLKEKGPFRDVMIDCMSSLRKNNAPLLATMNVFIQEPSVDWLENARRFEPADPNDVHQWYPLQKIDQAKRKLQGTPSALIVIEDLKSSSYYISHNNYFTAYASLVKGDEQHDLRARLNNRETLSVEHQIDSLIDHATDPNLLGRMFAGWNAFV